MEITRKFGFDAAHRLTKDPKSPCYHLHGHRYECELTFESSDLDDEGMVLNFHTIKSHFVSPLMEILDHGIILNKEDPSGVVELCKDAEWKILLLGTPSGMLGMNLSIEPTVENIARFIQRYSLEISRVKFAGKFKIGVKLYETPNCFALIPPDFC